MRLWHEDLIKKLPREQLLGQHRECCALRGNGWGRRHATVNYVFNYSPYFLYRYHLLIIEEMKSRGYNISDEWLDKNYRGRCAPSYKNLDSVQISYPIYKEHNSEYYNECIENLKSKNIIL